MVSFSVVLVVLTVVVIDFAVVVVVLTVVEVLYDVVVFLSEFAFSSQTKERLTTDKKYLEKFIPMISNSIYKWLRKNEEIREGLIKRFQEYRASQNKL